LAVVGSPLPELPSPPVSDPAGVVEPSDPAEPPSDVAESAALAALRDAVLRSFFAQPLPLKWIVGAEKALRTGLAPQIGQTLGPSTVSEWMTSNRWPFGQM
jgi:hypothetical protein